MENKQGELELSIVMPCRDEVQTVGLCVKAARDFMEKNGIRGEVLVVDNGSSDGSGMAARRSGARVISVQRPGYGRALRAGLRASRGRVIIMGDCDCTYDFGEIGKMVCMLTREGYDVVIGDRFRGGIEKGAMPLSHYVGVRWLSWLGRRRFHTNVRDFHCGLRGMTRQALKRLRLRTTGMEFATEMIALAAGAGLRIGQVPVSLQRCRYDRHSKLRAVRDGMRHLKVLMS